MLKLCTLAWEELSPQRCKQGRKLIFLMARQSTLRAVDLWKSCICGVRTVSKCGSCRAIRDEARGRVLRKVGTLCTGAVDWAVNRVPRAAEAVKSEIDKRKRVIAAVRVGRCGCIRVPLRYIIYTAISRKVVGKSARVISERYCGWVWVHCSSKKCKRIARDTMDICLRVLKESSKFRLGGCSVSDISHITFRDCRVHIFSDNPSRNSCIHQKTSCISYERYYNILKHLIFKVWISANFKHLLLLARKLKEPWWDDFESRLFSSLLTITMTFTIVINFVYFFSSYVASIQIKYKFLWSF